MFQKELYLNLVNYFLRITEIFRLNLKFYEACTMATEKISVTPLFYGVINLNLVHGSGVYHRSTQQMSFELIQK